jgi:hypothetical protein
MSVPEEDTFFEDEKVVQCCIHSCSNEVIISRTQPDPLCWRHAHCFDRFQPEDDYERT